MAVIRQSKVNLFRYSGAAVFTVAADGGAVAGGAATIITTSVMEASGGAVAGGSAVVAPGYILSPTDGAVAGGETIPAVGARASVSGGAVAGGSAVSVGMFRQAVSGGAVGGGETAPAGIIPALSAPPAARQDTTPLPAPGPSGQWSASLAPALPAQDYLAPIYALTSYNITLNLSDITGKIERCTIEESEAAAFGTCSFDLPVGIDISQGDAVAVMLAGVTHTYLVEDIDASGPKRSVFCRSTAGLLDEPHAAAKNWNGWDTPHTTAHALAAAICGAVPLVWSLPDWSLPSRWELSGTPIEALQRLVASVGGIVTSNPDGSVSARRRWPVRPPRLAAEPAVATIDRDTALSVSCKAVPGKGYGSALVYGYDPAADLPDFEVEEQSPKLGQPVHVRLFWRTPSPPPFSSFITDGQAAHIENGVVVISNEEVMFDQGRGAVKYPMRQLHGFRWVGNDQGDIWWLENGDSRELSTVSPAVRGIAEVTYTAAYERWRLTGQTARKCVFGVDVDQGQVSAKVSYTSGGALAPSITAPLINDTGGCVEAGTAFLDTNRAHYVVAAELPLTSDQIIAGAVVMVNDPVTGAVGKGKVASASIVLEPRKTTRRVEVHLPC